MRDLGRGIRMEAAGLDGCRARPVRTRCRGDLCWQVLSNLRDLGGLLVPLCVCR